MQAFVDESGGKGQIGWLVFVGLIGKAEEWAAFADEWKRVLDLPPAIEAWHMREAATFRRAFKGWSRDERDSRARRLAETVNNYSFTAISCSVDVQAYKDIITASRTNLAPRKSEVARIGKVIGEPYFLCFNSMTMAVCYELLEQGVTERFELIFDDDPILGPRVRRWYPVFRSHMEPHEQAIMPVDPLFRNDVEFRPLQVSDMLAWLVHRELNGLDHTFDWIPNVMHGLTWSGHRQLFDRKRLQGILDLSIQQPISDEKMVLANRLLGLSRDQL
jgi:hypothetical protein